MLRRFRRWLCRLFDRPPSYLVSTHGVYDVDHGVIAFLNDHGYRVFTIHNREQTPRPLYIIYRNRCTVGMFIDMEVFVFPTTDDFILSLSKRMIAPNQYGMFTSNTHWLVIGDDLWSFERVNLNDPNAFESLTDAIERQFGAGAL